MDTAIVAIWNEEDGSQTIVHYTPDDMPAFNYPYEHFDADGNKDGEGVMTPDSDDPPGVQSQEDHFAENGL